MEGGRDGGGGRGYDRMRGEKREEMTWGLGQYGMVGGKEGKKG